MVGQRSPNPLKSGVQYCHDIGFDVSKLMDEIDWSFFEDIEYDFDDEE